MAERCGCNCKICLERVYESNDLEVGETFCPGPCPHTDAERAKGLFSILADENTVKELFDVSDGHVEDTPV
jgi:hypothetical protein